MPPLIPEQPQLAEKEEPAVLEELTHSEPEQADENASTETPEEPAEEENKPE